MPGTGFSTRQLHAGTPHPHASPRATPIYLTAGFVFDEYDAAEAHFRDGQGYAYTRIANPTIDDVESRLAALEGGSGALLVASGQAATTIALLSLASAGDHVIASNHIYEGTRGLLLDNLQRFGIESDFVDDIDDPAAWEALVRPTTKVLFAESISNASNRVLDTRAIANVAHRHAIPLVVDNTLATPYLHRPLELGADLVVHSTSKFLTGHGTALGGVIIDSGRYDPRTQSARFPHLHAAGRGTDVSVADRAGQHAVLTYARDVLAPRFGPTPSPFNAFLIAQGIETLSLRVERQSSNALSLARWLQTQPEVASVDYAGLTDHPSHAVASRDYQGGFGSVFTITLRGGAHAARAWISALRVITHMTHLGDVRSLALHPASTSHVLLSPDEQARVGVFPGTVRLSIGIEDLADLIADAERGFTAVTAAAAADIYA